MVLLHPLPPSISVDICPLFLSMGCNWISTLILSTWAAAWSLFWWMKNLLPLLHWHWYLQGFFAHLFFTLSLITGMRHFLPFLIHYHKGPVLLIGSALNSSEAGSLCEGGSCSLIIQGTLPHNHKLVTLITSTEYYKAFLYLLSAVTLSLWSSKTPGKYLCDLMFDINT